jgi:hypothetical protein
MHKGCGRRSNVFITNGAEMQTHDCCTKHPCARKLAEAERALGDIRAAIREMAADALSREAQYEELERAELARDAMWEKDRAALARVRDLCDEAERFGSTLPNENWVTTTQVRAVLGDTDA